MRDVPRSVMWKTINDMDMDECTAMAKQAGVKCVFEGEYEGFPVCDECIDKLCDWMYDDEPLVCHCDNLKEATAIASKGELKQGECQNKFKEAADLFEEAIEEHGYGSSQCEIQLFRMMEAARILPDKKSGLIPIELSSFDGFEFSVLDRKIFYKGASVNAHELAKLLFQLFAEDCKYSREQRIENVEAIIHPFLLRIGKKNL